MRDTSQLSMVFVGCGGTFFMGVPLFRVLMHRCKPRLTMFVDPDTVLGKNQDRQWPHREDRGTDKADLAWDEFTGCNSYAVCKTFSDFADRIDSGVLYKHPKIAPLKDVLLVVNVDNDAARLEVREWARNRKGWTGMVVSGCEADYGQAYWGAWQNGVAMHDWQVLHEDVGREEEVEQRYTCMPQTAEANALTGVLAGLALRDLLEIYQIHNLPTMVREYYWERSHPPLSLVKSWTLEVVRQRGER